MTVCGMVRLDGTDARRSTLTAMLAASPGGLPAARSVHLDGPFGVVTAPPSRSLPMPPVVAERDGLVVVLEGADVGVEAARQLAEQFRVQGGRSLVGASVARLAMVWDSDRRRLFVARDGRAAESVLTWSDGQVFAFGTQAEHLVAAGVPRVATVGTIGRPRPGARPASVRRLAPGDHESVTVTAGRARRGRRALRLVRPLSEPAG